jgi:hypothetical protein
VDEDPRAGESPAQDPELAAPCGFPADSSCAGADSEGDTTAAGDTVGGADPEGDTAAASGTMAGGSASAGVLLPSAGHIK